MNITVTVDGKRYKAQLPYPTAQYVNAPNAPECSCGVTHFYGGAQTTEHDTVSAQAFCAKCYEPRGTIVVKVDTIFGIEEDDRTLNGRCRVY